MSDSPYDEYDFEGMPYTGQIHPNDRDFDARLADRNKDGQLSSWERAVGNQVARGTRQHKSSKFWSGWEDKDSRLFHRGRFYERDSELPRGFLKDPHYQTTYRWAAEDKGIMGNKTLWALGGLAAIALVIPKFLGQTSTTNDVETKDAEGDCGCNHNKEGETEAFDSEYSIHRVNPVVVEGAQDVYGAEGIISARGLSLNADSGWTMPPSPVAYETPTGAMTNVDEMFYDPMNDFMPEYRFPSPWSPSYNPRDSYRPADYQTYGSYTPRFLGPEY